MSSTKRWHRWGDIPDWSWPAIDSLLSSLGYVDPETADHCRRVGIRSKVLAKAAGFNEFEIKMAEVAGALHDIGKIGIAKAIIHKPTKLTTEEFDVMKEHPLMSVEIIKPLLVNVFFQQAAEAVRSHHERIDGKGYPHHLMGDQIPELARVVLIVDAFDAMTQDRAYRKGLPKEVALQEIKDHAGTQFDEQLSKIFLDLYKIEGQELQKLDQKIKKLKKVA